MKTTNYSRLICSMLLILGLWTTNSFAQTTLIDPAGDGGFNNGSTFAANGWTVANFASSVNQWVVGTAISTPPFSGNSAYISLDAGVTNTYNTASSNSVYFYRDVNVPAGQLTMMLTFNWNGFGESGWDMIEVWAAPTSVIPTGEAHPGFGLCTPIPASLTGATCLGTFQLVSTIQTATITFTVPASGPRRIIFNWKSDTSVGTQPAGSVDNISLVTIPPCSAPTAQPTGLALTPLTPSQINGTFTAASPASDGYLVVRYVTGSAVTNPVNGTTYTVGGALGLGTVVQAGAGTSFSATGLLDNTSYDFYVYSMNNICTGGPLYITAGPLTGTAATPVCLTPTAQGTGLGLTPISISQINGTFTAASPATDGYLVVGYISGSTEVPPVDGTVYAAGGALGFGKVVQSSNATSFSATGLIAGTSYDVYVYSYNICPTGRKYFLAGRLTATASTLAATGYTATAQGGLWSNAQTWVGGVAPVAGNDVSIPAGSIVTVNVAVTIRNLDISGLLQWNTVANAMTLQGNLTVNSGGVFLPYTSAITPLGITVNIFGNFINNGYANCALGTGTQTLIAFNGIGSTLGGTGTFQTGIDGRGIIRQLFFQSLGSSTINTAQDLTTLNLAHGAGSLNTNGKLKIDNVFQLYGMALNTQVASVAVTTMGTYSVAPVVFGVAVIQYANALAATANSRYVSGTHVYLCTVAGTFNATAPTWTTITPDATSGPTLLYIGETGTLGNPYQITTTVLGTQYFFNGSLYTCITAGIPTAAGAAALGTTPGIPYTSGTAVFRYAGSPAMVSVNFNPAATLNVRSLTLTSGGSGYSSSTGPTLVFSVGVAGGTVTTTAAATPVILYSIFGPVSSQVQRSGVATFTGGLIINSDQGASASGNIQSSSGVGNIFTTAGGTNYTVAPQIAFGGPLALNLITNPGSGYTTTPSITVTGGTLIAGSAYVSGNFLITVNQGTIESVYLNTTSAVYSVPPTLTMSAPGGAGTTATLEFPAGCWPAATANIGTNGQILSFTMTNSGFGYTSAPLVAFGPTSGTPQGGTFTTAATAPTARVAVYNVILNFFAPATSAVAAPDDAMIPSNRKINNLALNGNGNGFNLGSNLTLYGTAPLTLVASLSTPGNILNLNGNNLLFTWNGYAGAFSTFNNGGTNVYIKNGSMTLTGRGGAGTFNYPFAGTTTSGVFTWFVGSTPTVVTTGCNATKYTVTELGAPSNGTLGNGSAIGNRAYRAQFNAGAVSGTNPTVTMHFNSLDGLSTTQDLLFIGDAPALSGPWTVRSTAFGASGALPATGSKVTATVAPGPITINADNYYAWLMALPCTGPPDVAVVTGPSTACSAASITLTAAGVSSNLGITRQWQSASSCGGSWTNIAGANGPTLTTTQTATTSYRMLVTCTFTSQSTPSNCITVTGASGVTMPILSSVTANPTPVCFNGSSTLTANASLPSGPNYAMTPLTGQTYTPLSGGGITIINTNAQLTVGMGSGTEDDAGVVINIPFTFTYMGTPYTQMSMCTNGWVGAGNWGTIDAVTMRTAGNLFISTIPNSTIAAWFKDMGANFPTGTGSMRHGLIGTDVYAFQWDNATGSGFSDASAILISFQINIYGPASIAPGRIELIYGPTVGAIAFAASIGIEDATGGPSHYINALTGDGTSTTLSTVWPGNGNGYRFDPNTPPTLTYAWTTSGPGGLSSATTNPTTGTSITGSTTYNVTVANGACVVAGSASVAPGGPLGTTVTATPPSSASAYCTPVYTSYDGTDYISNVTLNGSPAINNTSGATVLPGYSPFLNISTTLTAGGTFTISVTDGSFGSQENLTAFIDYNQNGVFDVATEQILPNFITTAAFQTTTATFTVPVNAFNGTTRLRVVDNYFTTPAPPCPTAGFGETEDYTINITGGVTQSTLVCPGLPWTLSAVTTGGGAPYTILWSGDPAATAGLITNNTATVTAIPLAPTTYTVVITDNCGVSVTQSVFVNVRMTDPTIGTVTASATSGCGVTPVPPNIQSAPVTFTLDAFTGDNLIWQFNVNGGAWTTIPGVITPTAVLIATIPQGGGPVTFGLRAQSYFCAINPATSNAVTFIMDDPAAPTAVTGGARCGPGIVPVTASVPAGQTVEWYSAATGGTLLGSGSSFNYPATASTTIYAADRNPASGCLGSLRMASSITVNNIPTVTATSNSPVCTPSAINLTGTSGSMPSAGGSFFNYTTTAGANFFPFGVSTGKEVQWFVAPGEFATPSPAPGGSITTISFYAAATGTTTFSNFTIKLGQTSSAYAGGALYSGPLTTVILPTTTTITTTIGTWFTLTLDVPFTYDPGQWLVVDVSQCGYTGTGFTVYQNTLTGVRRVWSVGGCPFTWFGNDANLPGITIGMANQTFNYAWTGPISFSSFDQNPVISPSILTREGTYTVTITDNGTGCNSSATTSVIVNQAPAIVSLQSATLNGGVATVFPGPSTFLDIPVFTTATTCDKVVNYNVAITGKPDPAEAVGGITHTFSGATIGSGNGTGTGSTFGRLIPTGRTTVNVTANNVCGSQTKTFRVTVTDNVAPVITPIQVSATNTNGGECASTVQVTQPSLGNGLFDNCPNASLIWVSRSDGRSQFEPYYAGTTTVTWQATDASANVTTATQNVVVNNIKPVITSFTSSAGNLIFVGQTTTYTAVFTDEDGGGTHTIKFYRDKNDAAPANIKTLAPNCTQSCSGVRSYSVTSDPILYSNSEVAEPKVEILDGCNLAADQVPGVTTLQYLAIAVAGTQFTTAGGHYTMPAGGYPSSYVGLDVSMGNVVKPATNGNSFKGQLEMNVHLSNGNNWRVHTDNGSNQDITWDYLTVSGCSLATFKGAVLLNGVSGYKVLVQQSDKDRNPATSNFIRVKVTTNSGTVVFDTQPGLTEALTSSNGGAAAIITALTGGTIKVHPVNNNCTSRMEGSIEGGGLSQNMPNPFNGETEIRFSVTENGLYTLKVYNYLGQAVTTLFNGEATTGTVYSVIFDGSDMQDGIYTYTLSGASMNETRRMNVIK